MSYEIELKILASSSITGAESMINSGIPESYLI